jgi:very-short-patch-repair endonuclease
VSAPSPARRHGHRATGFRPHTAPAIDHPEDILWSLLRNRRLYGLKFRRQVPLFGYTVDFVCIDRRLIVEVDGHQHGWEAAYDAERTAEIERHGFTLMRFGNAEIIDDRDAVLAAIRAAAGG